MKEEGRVRPGPAAAAAGLILLAASSALVKARSYDLWWHLEAGEQILKTLSIPRADAFSFTSAGAPWIDHEWLFQVLLYGFHALGPIGFTLLKGACALAVAAIGYCTLRRTGSRAGTALVVVALSLAGMRSRLGERPEAVTLVMAAAFAALGLSSSSRSPARRLGWMALLAILWVNVHAGALLAPVLMLACAGGGTLDYFRSSGPGRADIRPAWFAVPMTALCLLVNPFGYRIYLVPSEIAEALSPAKLTNPEWAVPSWHEFPLLYLALAAAAAAVLLRLRQRRPLAGERLGIFLLAAVLALTSVRHIGLFFALLPLLVDAAPSSTRAFAGGRVRGAAAVIAAAVWMISVAPPGAEIGIGVQPARFPERAVDFIDAHLKDARLYNDVSTGGYLIWRGYPGRRVFIDGRNEVHAALLKDLAGSIDDGRRWRDLLERHGVEGAIVLYRRERVPAVDAVTREGSWSTFSDLHFPKPAWALVYWDDVAMVFVARHGRNSAMPEALEYREARPEAWALGIYDEGPRHAAEGLAGEIRRKLAQDPGCHLALAAAAKYGVIVR